MSTVIPQRHRSNVLNDPTVLLNAILESPAKYSIFVMDLEGRIVAWNEGAHVITAILPKR
jgi:hypothetical protein